MKELQEKLLNIQSELSVPKNQYNKFGKYNYRNAEDILEAVKPLCLKNNVVLLITDDLKLIGDRFYICSTVMLTDGESSISSNGYAREPETQTGMHENQLTGSSSSYARKYALNGLFCIDDTKDSDHDSQSKKNNKPVVDETVYLAYKKKIDDCDTKEKLEKIAPELTKARTDLSNDRFNDLTKHYKLVKQGFENATKQ